MSHLKANSELTEGIRTGLLGALAVALVFLAHDLALGRPGWTPSVLGQVVMSGGGKIPVVDRVLLLPLVVYTAIHLLLFAAFGVVLIRIITLAERERIFRTALVIMFVTFEVFFAGLLEIGVGTTRGLFPLWTVLTANAVAAITMGTYAMRGHPATIKAFLADAKGY